MKGYITLNNKKYFYTLKEKSKKEVFFECPQAKISQIFLNEDIPSLLIDLPNLIIAEKEYQNNQSEVVRFRISSGDKKKIEIKASKNGYNSVSDYLRKLALS
ncbi:MAG: hypothetical protein V1851_02475 [Patescibacteria group bacterium]